MKTIHVYALIQHKGIDVVISDFVTLCELRQVCAQFMEIETHGQFLAHTDNYLLRLSDHTFLQGECLIKDVQIKNGECFYIF